MSIQKLIILGVLKQGPKHGYEIKKIIRKELGVFTSLENKSIYYPLKLMEKKGMIKKSTAKERGKIEKHVYSLSPRGNKEFLRLAMAALLSQKRPFIDLDIPLYFLPYLDRKMVSSHLRLKKRFLEEVRKWLTGKLKNESKFPAHQELLLRHHLNLLNAEEEFVDEVIRIINPVRSTKVAGK
jgi:DNA-binding PadR family transcriptional regulator